MPNHSIEDLAGDNDLYQSVVESLHENYGFDFVSLGLTAFIGAPLKWVYGAGATSDRYKRIALSPGHGIGGIVIKSGKPMVFLDIDKQIDPREYSSYPIVFAEDLRSFCALPLLKKNRVVGALLCAHRSSRPEYEEKYRALIEDLKGSFLMFKVNTRDFLGQNDLFSKESLDESIEVNADSSFSQTINAQENERRRISRELHDGIAQELLSVSFLLKQMRAEKDPEALQGLFTDVDNKIGSVLDEIHNLSVELRPSTLDHLGLAAALRSRSQIFEKNYGARVNVTDKLSQKRFARSLETQVYRICQEAILNACKYSGTDFVLVTLEDADGWLCATIKDEGQGFDTIQPEIRGSGCGLSGMRERANLINANLTIESGLKGTTISLVAPLISEKKD